VCIINLHKRAILKSDASYGFGRLDVWKGSSSTRHDGIAYKSLSLDIIETCIAKIASSYRRHPSIAFPEQK